MATTNQTECVQPQWLPDSTPWRVPRPGLPHWPELPPWAQPVYVPCHPHPSRVWC